MSSTMPRPSGFPGHRFPPRYFLASVGLLLLLVGLSTMSAVRRTRQELGQQLEEKGRAVAEALEVSSESAIRGNALMEEMIAQRLLDNARLLDRMLAYRLDPALLGEISAMNRLRRIELLDADGRPWTPPPLPPMGMMVDRMRHRTDHDEAQGRTRETMMTYLWGRRWGPAGPAAVPPVIASRMFWEGSVFGVALGARSFPGIIAIHADADFVLNFARQIGVERHVEELGRRSGIVFIALLDRGRRVLARSGPVPEPPAGVDEVARAALGPGHAATRLIDAADGTRVLEVVTSVMLAGGEAGLLRIGLGTEAMDRAWRRERDRGILLGAGVLALGAFGMAVIFYMQQRHLKDVQGLEAEMGEREHLAGLGNMAATVAHEIRNPLNAVSMGLQRLGAEFHPSQDEDYRRLVALMQGEVTRLNGIVEEFLSLARPLTLARESVPIADLFGELTALLENEARTQQVRLVIDVPAELPAPMGDRNRLKQVLLNLGLNALEAMPDGGTLTLGATTERQGVTFSVTDTGRGIPADLLPRIFEPWVTTKTRGLGLGLAVARRVVEAHGGRIEVASAPGRGSRFRVVLPLDGATA